MDKVTFGKMLREYRETVLNMTQSEAAEKAGVNLLAYQNWEYGKKVPRSKNLASLFSGDALLNEKVQKLRYELLYGEETPEEVPIKKKEKNMKIRKAKKEEKKRENILLIGGAGCGKTLEMATKLVAMEKDNGIVLDKHGELYEKTHKILRKKGYKIITVRTGGASWNNTAEVRKIFISSFLRGGDEFWKSAMDTALQNLFFITHNSVKDAKAACEEKLKDENTDPMLPKKTKTAVYESLYVLLYGLEKMDTEDNITSSDGRVFETIEECIDVYRSENAKFVLYIMDNEDNDLPEWLTGAISRLQLSRTIYDTSARFNVFINDLEAFPEYPEFANNENASFIVNVQSIGQLDAICGGKTNQFLGLFDVYECLGVEDSLTANFLCDVAKNGIKPLGKVRIFDRDKGKRPALSNILLPDEIYLLDDRMKIVISDGVRFVRKDFSWFLND